MSPSPSKPDIKRLSGINRAFRLTVTLSVAALLILTTFWGQDADFPFAPFRMYSTSASLNKPVKSTRLEAVTAEGKRLVVQGKAVGLRRAEFEGQVRRFRKNPELMKAMAAAYKRRHAGQPPLVRIELIVRNFELIDGKPTKKYTDKVVVSWERGGA